MGWQAINLSSQRAQVDGCDGCHTVGRKHCDDAVLCCEAPYGVASLRRFGYQNGLAGYKPIQATELKSTGVTAVTLWAASIVTIVMMLFYVVKLLTG